MRKIKIAIVGANGRMGLEFRQLLRQSNTFESSVAIVREGLCDDFKKTVNSWSQVSKSDVDVIIDFSTPEMLRKSLQFASRAAVPLVAGVTGLTPADHKALKAASNKTAILWSANMSLGVAILKATLAHFSQLKHFDFQIIEAHHNKKKDSPSGTAIVLQQALEKAIRRSAPKPLSIRGGGIIGDHTVMAMSDEEILEFSHSAIHRSVFAKGALLAAEWISKRSNGQFTMEDVIRGA
jgi:4-hydroxy-tetrahydrodipicolinate reductase